MYAKITLVQFQPGAADEAVHIFRDIMIPNASTQQGFKGAMMFKSATQADKYTIFSLWESKEDLDASAPPEHILPDLARLGALTVETSQDSAETILLMDNMGVNLL